MTNRPHSAETRRKMLTADVRKAIDEWTALGYAVEIRRKIICRKRISPLYNSMPIRHIDCMGTGRRPTGGIQMDTAATIRAEQFASKWLGNGNEAEERGDIKMAEKCFQKAQYWLDRYNKLAGNA